MPYELNVNAIERNCILEKLNYFKDLGFEIESSVNGNFMVYQIPLELIDIDLDSFFNDVLCDYSFRRETIPEILNEKIMQKACKSAVKAGMQLSNSEVESLVILLNGNINLKCPHGRPIAVKISKNEIDKWFKRVLWWIKL